MRYHINEWKTDSFKKYNYKCDISGINSANLIIHHLYNFSEIVKETMNLLELPIYDKVNKYSDDELIQIENKCVELHYKYGLGVCLCENEHKLFHSRYGVKNNTKEQYLEFRENRLKELNLEVAS